jgi:hypothetical protein
VLCSLWGAPELRLGEAVSPGRALLAGLLAVAVAGADVPEAKAEAKGAMSVIR